MFAEAKRQTDIDCRQTLRKSFSGREFIIFHAEVDGSTGDMGSGRLPCLDNVDSPNIQKLFSARLAHPLVHGLRRCGHQRTKIYQLMSSPPRAAAGAVRGEELRRGVPLRRPRDLVVHLDLHGSRPLLLECLAQADDMHRWVRG